MEIQEECQEPDLEAQEEQQYGKILREMKEKEESKINVLQKAKKASECTLQRMLDEPF